MREVAEFLGKYSAYFLIGLSLLSLCFIGCIVSLSKKLARISRRRETRIEDGRVEDIVEFLSSQSEVISAVQSRLNEIRSIQDEQYSALSACLRKIGIVRFNAFDDVGGEQSFSLAMLDADNNGVVISSLYGRQDSRMYAKVIVNGKGERALSDEELEAVRQAAG